MEQVKEMEQLTYKSEEILEWDCGPNGRPAEKIRDNHKIEP